MIKMEHKKTAENDFHKANKAIDLVKAGTIALSAVLLVGSTIRKKLTKKDG